MKKLSIAVLCVLVGGITVFLLWLHDLRASYALSEMQLQIVDKRLVVSKLEDNTRVLQEFLASDTPLNTRLAAEVRRQNPEVTEDQFPQWLQMNEAVLRAKAENVIRSIPAVLTARKAELTDLQSQVDDCGKPWIFHR